MASVLTGIGEWFWSESFWLPPNTTWADLERDDTIFIPNANDLWIPFPIALCLFILRLVWERVVGYPIGKWYKLKETAPRPVTANPVLDAAFKESRKSLPDHANVEALAKKLDWNTRQVERWWRRKRMHGKPSEMQKFKETTWRFLFYICAFWYGVYILWEKPWLWETKHCWYNYPRQHVTDDIWWYYMLELGFYFSLVLSLFMDTQRKDFGEMMIHHAATISLLVLSWSNNMVRIGTLVLVIHDAVDYWLEGAKICKYLRYHTLCDAIFMIFTFLWFVTRLVMYPLKILWSSAVESLAIGWYRVYIIFNGLLFTLQVLHVVWFIMILRMVYEYIINGKIEKDDRSETEPESTSDEDHDRSVQMNGSVQKQNGPVSTIANNNVKDFQEPELTKST